MRKLPVYLESDNQYLRLAIESILTTMGNEECEFELMPLGSAVFSQEICTVLFDDYIKALSFRYSLFFNAEYLKLCQFTNVFTVGSPHVGGTMPCIQTLPMGARLETGSRKLAMAMSFRGDNCGRCPKCPFMVLNNDDMLLVRLMSDEESNVHIRDHMRLTSKTLSYKKHRIKQLFGMDSIFQLYRFVLSLPMRKLLGIRHKA